MQRVSILVFIFGLAALQGCGSGTADSGQIKAVDVNKAIQNAPTMNDTQKSAAVQDNQNGMAEAQAMKRAAQAQHGGS